MKFPISSGVVMLSSAADAVGDVFTDSLRLENASNARCRASTTGGAYVSQGLTFTSTGRLLYVDATAGLPSDAVISNGLPMSAGALCISTDTVATVQNGIPFAANGAVSAGVTP